MIQIIKKKNITRPETTDTSIKVYEATELKQLLNTDKGILVLF